jgi:hypothetical protein
MKTHRIFPVLILVGIFWVAVAGGQEASQEAIPNWPAPATWSPHSVSRGLSTMGAVTSPFPFIGLDPCRVADTRGNGAPIQGGIFANSEARNWTVSGICGIPSGAGAISVNFTVVAAGGIPAGSFLLAWPTGSPPVQTTAIMTYGPGQIISNAAIVPLSSGQLTVNVSGSTHIIMDVNGYYAPSGVSAHSTFLGLNAGNFTMTGDNNTAIGWLALESNTTGGSNTAIGVGGLSLNTSGNTNTAIGGDALDFNTSGGGNTAIGDSALLVNSSGNSNTAIGSLALELSTGSNNIGIGFFAGGNQQTGSHDIYIGNAGVNGESNTIRIGDASFQDGGTIITGISGLGAVGGSPVYVTGGGRLGTNPASSRHFKQDIRDIAGDSDRLMKLRPVAFRYKPEFDATGVTQYGLIAEEVAEVFPDLVTSDRDGQPEGVRYHLITPLLLNEVQKQRRIAEALEKRIEQQNEIIEQQKETIDHEQAEIEGLKARMGKLEARLLTESRP